MSGTVWTNGFVGSLGLLLDVAGAFFLAESFVLKKRTQMIEEAGTYFDYNKYALASSAQQAFEARTGFVFLAFGFFGQYLAYSGWFDNGANPKPRTTLFFGLLAVVVVCAVGRWASAKYRDHVVNSFVADFKEKERKAKEAKELEREARKEEEEARKAEAAKPPTHPPNDA